MVSKQVFVSIVLCISVLFTTRLYAQDSTNFFPHQVGDMWEYFFTDFIGNDTIQVFVIADSLDSEGNYHVIQAARSINPVAPPIFFFRDTTAYIIDTLNQVLTNFSFGTGPLPLFKLDAQEDEQWVLWGYPGYYEMARVTRVYQDILFNISTTFKDYVYYLAADSSDTTGLIRNYYTLADGFGLVFGSGETGQFLAIRGAVISNVFYGDTTLVAIHPTLHHSIPEQFHLYQNYPNPFNPRTTIPFQLNRSGRISILLYDAAGRMVRKLIDNQWYPVGEHKIIWDGKTQKGGDAASGIYFYQLIVGQQRATRLMLLIR